MKKLLLALVFIFIPGIAWAQCTGVFPTNTFCGNNSGVPGVPTAIPAPSLSNVTSGLANAMPFYQSNGSTLVSTFTLPLGFGIQGAKNTNDQQPKGISTPVWNRLGVAIDPTAPNCDNGGGANTGVQERAILYEGNPQLLTSYPNVFKMWFHADFSSHAHIHYAESGDGINWTCSPSNPLITDETMPRNVIKDAGGIYHLFTANPISGNIDHFTATTPALAATSWTLANASIVTSGSSWELGALFNPGVILDGTTWRMLYSAGSNSGTCSSFKFAIGAATATSAGGPWTKSVSNPVMVDLCPSGPSIYKSASGSFFVWSQITGGNPVISDMARFRSTNFTSSWTRDTPSIFTFTRADTDEGVANTSGQVADPTLIQVGNQTFMYYTATADQTVFKIKVAVANMPIEQLITTNEGQLPNFASAQAGNPLQVGLGPNVETQTLQFTNLFGIHGYNAFYNTNGVITPITSGIPGWIERWQTNTNNAVNMTQLFVNTAGTGVLGWAADMTSGGAANTFTVGAQDFCLDSASLGSCAFNLRAWGGGGFLVNQGSASNSGTGNMFFSAWRSAESAGFGGSASVGHLWDDSTAHRFLFNYNSGNNLTLPGMPGLGTFTTSGGSISSNTCVTQTVSLPIITSTDVLHYTFQGAPPTSWLSISVFPYVTVGFANFQFCNPSAGALSPAAITINYQVTR